jgi:hypothetical protein
LLEILKADPVGALLFHLPVGIAPAFERLQRLLQRLRDVAVVDHAAPHIDDFVDLLDQQRAFFFAGATGGARPDFVFGIDVPDQRHAIASVTEHGVVLERVIASLDADEPR